MTLRKIAGILQARGQLDDALRIVREEVLPVYARMGAQRDLLVGQANLAITHLRRAQPGDREAAQVLLEKAAATAIDLNLLIESEQIRHLQESAGFVVPPRSEG